MYEKKRQGEDAAGRRKDFNGVTGSKRREKDTRGSGLSERPL
jgi:hypothetical protein